ncbi:hypothetical protein [Nonomuraea jiangxiensis]|uniref:hypothetical protein n=1 Tax=Nonomuraea jiangxiensis TaxID=633440 RepID=UPI003CCC3BA6
MGASTAPSSSAAARGQPGTAMATAAVPATVSGIAQPSSRQVVPQLRNPIRRLSARPAPMSETSTQISVMCTMATRWAIGSGRGRPSGSRYRAMPPSR